MSRATEQYNRGFTLIEILVAIFILSIGILGLAYAFPPGIQTARNSEKEAQAVTLAQAKIEEVLSLSYGALGTGLVEERHQLEKYPAFERETKVAYVDPDPTKDLPEIDDDLGFKKIVVNVFWKMPFSIGDRSIQLITLFSKR